MRRRSSRANVNRDLLEQALRNLGENAAKHTAARGASSLRAYAAGSTVRVEVEDTGVGMSRETQRHVFDRFYRGADRDAEGFGLGLAIVRAGGAQPRRPHRARLGAGRGDARPHRARARAGARGGAGA